MTNGIIKNKLDGQIFILSRYFTFLAEALRKLRIEQIKGDMKGAGNIEE